MKTFGEVLNEAKIETQKLEALMNAQKEIKNNISKVFTVAEWDIFWNVMTNV